VNVIARQIRAQGPGRIAGIFDGCFDVNHRIEARFGRALALVVVANPLVHDLSGLLVVADVLDGVAKGEDWHPEDLLPGAVSFGDGLLVGGLQEGGADVLVGDVVHAHEQHHPSHRWKPQQFIEARQATKTCAIGGSQAPRPDGREGRQ